MRAGLYGFLALLAVVVVTQRPHEAEAVHTEALDGRTAQGGVVRLRLDGERVSSLVVDTIDSQCPRTQHLFTWARSVGQGNVGIRQTDSDFTVHEWPDPRFVHFHGSRLNVWMRGRVSPNRRRVDGTITYDETGADGACVAGPVRFSVSR